MQLKDLKLENKSLRSELQINNQRISSLKKTKYENYDVSDDSVHALEKRLYSSLFNESSKVLMKIFVISRYKLLQAVMLFFRNIVNVFKISNSCLINIFGL